MKYRKSLSRRTFLRGAGSVAVGLPMLDAMLTRSVFAAAPEPPVRAINLFFGLGVNKEFQDAGWTGPLEPLARYSSKLAMLRGVDTTEADSGQNNHFDGSGGVFVGAQPRGEVEAGGPSLDQVLRAEMYSNNRPSSLAMGSFFRRKRENGLSKTRFVHSWDELGAPVMDPLETPKALFDHLFGSDPSVENTVDDKTRRYERSILDSVLSQYQHFTGGGSNLGADSKHRLTTHLEQVRELEKRTFPADMSMTPPGDITCGQVNDPGTLPLLHGSDPDPGGGGPELNIDEWLNVWHLMADLYVTGLHCDLFRFGNALFTSAGERIRLAGDYIYDGSLFYSFKDVDNSTGAGATHEYWHNDSNSSNYSMMERHLHFMMHQMGYLLGKLDDENHLDANGGTLLDNMLIMMSTELGHGGGHTLRDVFHVVSGANGRIQTGVIHDLGANGVEVYNTCLKAYGVTRKMGRTDSSYYRGELNQILV